MQLQIEHLTMDYGKNRALDNISMTLTDGIYGLLGPNGAGKSTMMSILTGNLKQSSGEILFNGKRIQELGANYRARLGYMPQQQSYYPSFTVEQFLFYIAALRGMKRSEAAKRIAWSLELLSLSDARKQQLHTLSGGMRQRVLLAQAVLADPDILILDEPTAGLDPQQRIAVRNLIAQISLHKIVLISTHVVQDVEYVAKELILLSHGKILKQATAKALTDSLAHQVWELTVSEAQVDMLAEFGVVCGLATSKDGILVRLLSPQAPPFPCQNVCPDLEDVYLYHFGSEEKQCGMS